VREQAQERRRTITDIAREYLEGHGPYPGRVHVISLVSRFFADYFDLLDSWATWASDELENWDEGTDLTPALATSVRETLAEIAALRPATSLAGSPLPKGTK
jgi:hypothetical protein